MDFSIWSIVIILSKVFIYAGVAAMVGGSFVYLFNQPSDRLQLSVRKYLLLSISLGLVATLTNFLLQVGAFAEAGWSGMFDTTYLAILWDSAAADSSLYRIAGFILILSIFYLEPVLARFKLSNYQQPITYTGYFIALCLVARSFSIIGHTSELEMTSQLLLSAHIILVSWWMGSLVPLYLACNLLENKQLHAVMHRFGQQAAVVVSLLILCGLILTYQLLATFEALFTTPYGINLLTKLSVVSLILLIALRHKLTLVPGLLKATNKSNTLAKSIQLEIALAAIIFIATASLTTLVGPTH